MSKPLQPPHLQSLDCVKTILFLPLVFISSAHSYPDISQSCRYPNVISPVTSLQHCGQCSPELAQSIMTIVSGQTHEQVHFFFYTYKWTWSIAPILSILARIQTHEICTFPSYENIIIIVTKLHTNALSSNSVPLITRWKASEQLLSGGSGAIYATIMHASIMISIVILNNLT